MLLFTVTNSLHDVNISMTSVASVSPVEIALFKKSLFRFLLQVCILENVPFRRYWASGQTVIKVSWCKNFPNHNRKRAMRSMRSMRSMRGGLFAVLLHPQKDH